MLLIVYGATAGVSVVQLYAGAFFPGFMLALLYVGYVIVLAKLKPALMPPLPESERRVALPPFAQALAPRRRNAFAGLAARARRRARACRRARCWRSSSSPCCRCSSSAACSSRCTARAPRRWSSTSTAGLAADGRASSPDREPQESAGLIGLQEPEAEAGTEPKEEAQELSPPPAEARKPEAPTRRCGGAAGRRPRPRRERVPAPTWFWIVFAIGALGALLIYWLWTWERLEVFKMLLTSFFPLALLILAVLGSIVFGLATPAEAAAVGAFGGFLLAVAYRFIDHVRRSGGRSRGDRGVDHDARGRRDRQGVVVPHRQDERHGVLAVRRLVDLLGGVRAARRPGAHRAAGCCRSA